VAAEDLQGDRSVPEGDQRSGAGARWSHWRPEIVDEKHLEVSKIDYACEIVPKYRRVARRLDDGHHL
jgi:hypothetical protein